MSPTLPPGPIKTVETGNGPAPFYIIPFDKHGTCSGPLTRKDLVDKVASGEFSDVFIFSHGWNNDWEAATKRYEDFISGFIRMRGEYGLPYPPDYRPLLVGIFWPSTALVMPWERGPKFAAAGASTEDSEIADWQRELAELAADIDPATREEFYSLAQIRNASAAQNQRLAEILAGLVDAYDHADEEQTNSGEKPPSAHQLIERAKHLKPANQARQRAPGEFGFADDSGGTAQAAFSLSDLDPRGLVRTATVLQMKDRAGKIGKTAVGPLLQDILKADPDTRVHLLGHSYGGIVVLSALCTIPAAEFPRPVDSVLLLQPAVSQWCFAENVDGEGYPGGYRVALDRTRGPIFSTFSKNDSPLTKMFHLAVRRSKDKGQPQMAGEGDLPNPPSSFAALGGYGPAGLRADELQVVSMTLPAIRYALRNPPPKVVALRGDQTIAGHGDISVLATWWALYQQVDIPA